MVDLMGYINQQLLVIGIKLKIKLMDSNTKEKLYIELNNILDMMHNGVAKDSLADLIQKIYYNQL